MTDGIFRLFVLLLLGLALVGCGGGDSDSGFAGANTAIKVSITADKTTLQTNSINAGPNPAGPFTNTITVQVQKNDRLFPAPSVATDIVSGLSSGALFYLDGKPENEQCPAGATCPPTLPVPKAFRRLTFDDTTGTVTAHFHSSGTPGTVILRASVNDPDTQETVVADLTITVGPGVSTGIPASAKFLVDVSPLYISGQGYVPTVKQFQVQVLDDGGQTVPNPAGNNLQLQLLPNRPNGGEKLSAISAGGGTQEGTVVNTRTINGIAEIALFSGTLPGTVAIAAIADRADNNVDNGIQNPVTDVATIPIGSGQIASLTFTGPYPGAVAQRQNTLPLGDGDNINFATGVYSRAISVVAADEFGNPPPTGTFITFRLMDGPLTGYPDQGRGVFNIAGTDGNPVEGGNTFSTPGGGSSLTGARVNCQLVLEGGPGQVGGWIVSGVSGPNLLSVNNAFNSVPNTGFTVPYTVGCPPYSGNVANSFDDVVVQTDVNGLAATIINYPDEQLGRCFKLTAEANGGKAGAVMGKAQQGSVVLGDPCTSWYLGIPTGATLKTIPDSDEEKIFFVLPGQKDPATCPSCTKKLTLQLFDGGTPPSPLPAEEISVQVVITDPDKTDAIVAAVDVEVAEAGLEAAEEALADFAGAAGLNLTPVAPAIAKPEDCFINVPASGDTPATIAPNPGAKPECTVLKQLQDAVTAAQKALVDAQIKLAEAEAKDALFEPKVEVLPKNPVTGAQGIVVLTLTVTDLPPNGLVEFFISTVGPEIQADTIKVTAKPTQGSGGG